MLRNFIEGICAPWLWIFIPEGSKILERVEKKGKAMMMAFHEEDPGGRKTNRIDFKVPLSSSVAFHPVGHQNPIEEQNQAVAPLPVTGGLAPP